MDDPDRDRLRDEALRRAARDVRRVKLAHLVLVVPGGLALAAAVWLRSR